MSPESEASGTGLEILKNAVVRGMLVGLACPLLLLIVDLVLGRDPFQPAWMLDMGARALLFGLVAFPTAVLEGWFAPGERTLERSQSSTWKCILGALAVLALAVLCVPLVEGEALYLRNALNDGPAGGLRSISGVLKPWVFAWWLETGGLNAIPFALLAAGRLTTRRLVPQSGLCALSILGLALGKGSGLSMHTAHSCPVLLLGPFLPVLAWLADRLTIRAEAQR